MFSAQIDTKGLDKLERVARAVQASGDKALRRQVGIRLRRTAKPMQEAFKAGALGFLPYRGGLAEDVAAGMRFRTKVSLGATPSMRITASLPGHDLRAMNRGRLRHPTFGHRSGPYWVTQQIRPNWWTDSGLVALPDVRRELLGALDDLIKQLKETA